MQPKFEIPATASEIAPEIPTVAIDLSSAYSLPVSRNTGYSVAPWDSLPEENKDFTQEVAATRLIDYMTKAQALGASRINLILEAPLSFRFSCSEGQRATLNAHARSVELRTNYPTLDVASHGNRPWTLNAGASTALMALFFLKEIRRRAPDGISINLFEGFWSWVAKPKDHHTVTRSLVAHLRSRKEGFIVKLPTDKITSYRTALDLLDDTSPTVVTPPLIVFGHPDLARAYQPSGHSPLSASR